MPEKEDAAPRPGRVTVQAPPAASLQGRAPGPRQHGHGQNQRDWVMSDVPLSSLGQNKLEGGWNCKELTLTLETRPHT